MHVNKLTIKTYKVCKLKVWIFYWWKQWAWFLYVQKCSDFFLSFFLIVKMGVSCSSNTWLFFWACVIFSFTHIISRDDNVARRVRRIWSLLLPRMVLSYPIFVSPRMTGKIFLPHSCPLGPCKAPPHPIKLYFVLICP